MMDYADNFDEFEHIIDQFCYDIDFQLGCIIEKIKHYQKCYDEEKTDAAREVCLEYIGKLNNMYTDYMIDKCFMTLGLFPNSMGYNFTEADIKRRRDVLLERYKGGRDKDSIKMHNEIEKAYDFLQSFKT